MLNLKTSKFDTARKGRFDQAVFLEVQGQADRLGRKLSHAERQEVIDRMMIQGYKQFHLFEDGSAVHEIAGWFGYDLDQTGKTTKSSEPRTIQTSGRRDQKTWQGSCCQTSGRKLQPR